MYIHKVEARDLPDLWFQAVYDILDSGRRFTVDRGSFAGQTRLEYDFFVGHVMHPGAKPMLPDIPPACGLPDPVDHDYLYGGGNHERSYIEYLMTAEMLPGEAYTYGQRLAGCFVPVTNCYQSSVRRDCYIDEELMSNPKLISPDSLLNQIEMVIHVYKTYGPRNNQMVLQVAQPMDLLLKDPPCLRSIDTRIQDDALHFVVNFRSWDLWSGLPANLAAIQMLKEYMAGEIGVADGEMIVHTKGLHLYGYAEDLAKMRCMKSG